MMKKLYYSSIGPWLFGLFILIGILITDAYMQSEKDPLVLLELPMEYQTVPCGGEIIFKRNICSAKQITVSVEREIIDTTTGNSVKLNNETYTIGVGCENSVYTVKTPSHLKDGDYIYKPTLSYNVNLMKKIMKEAPPEKFSIDRKLCGRFHSQGNTIH